MIKEDDGANNVIGNTAWLTITAIFVKLIGMLYKIPLSHVLSDTGMGYFNAAYTIYSLLFLLGTAGVPKAIAVLISACSKQEKNDSYSIFFVASSLFSKIGFVLFALLFVFSVPIARWIGSPNAAPSIMLISPCLLLVSLGGVYRGYLSAVGDFSAIAIASLIEAGAKLAFGLILIFLGKALYLSLPWICGLAIVGVGIGTLASVIYLKINIKTEKANKKQRQFCFGGSEEGRIRRKILRIALPITLGSLAVGISSLTDLSMIIKCLEASGMSEEKATAIYGNYTTLAVPMLQLASALLSPIAVVLLPRLASNCAENEDFQSSLHFGCEMAAFISMPLAFIFFFFPGNLLTMLFPASSASLATPLLRLLSPGVVLLSMLLILNTILEASARAKSQMLSMLIGIFVKIPIGYIMLKNPDCGIVGAPVSTVIGYAASFLFSAVCVGTIGTCVTLLKSYVFPFFSSMLSLLCTTILSHFVLKNTYGFMHSFLLLSSFGIFYLCFAYLFGIFRLEKFTKMTDRTKNYA